MGLLNDFFGTPDQTQALGLLGVGMMNGGFGQGAGMAMQHLAQAPERDMNRQLGLLKMDDIRSEIEARKLKAAAAEQQAAFARQFLGGGGPQAAAPTVPGVPGAPAAGGQPAGDPVTMSAQTISRQYGVPVEAVIADFQFNGGKKIGEMISSRAAPKWENVNGHMVNVNAPGFSGGFQPGVAVSNDGKATMWQPDGQGGLVVGAPRGALETFGAYQNIGEGTKAAFDPVQVVGPDGAARFVPRSQVVGQPPRGQGAPSGAPRSPMSAMPGEADRFAILSQELATAQQSGNVRDVQAIQAEITRLPASARTQSNPSGLAVPGFQATPTTAQEIAKATALQQAKADVRPTEERRNEIAGGNYMLNILDQAINHPGRATATGMSGTLDPRNYLPGTDAKGFQSVIEQVRGNTFLAAYANLKGGGQITEVEGKKAENAIARLSMAQSDEDFVSALTELREVVAAGVERQQAAMRESGGNTSFAGDNSGMANKRPPVPMRGMVRNGYRFKGGDPAQQSNWEKM